jgi:hypothetical protein
MGGTALILLAGLEIKHYIADYLLQPAWLLKGKGSLTAPGGYVHAAIHAAGSLIVLVLVQVPLATIAWLCAAELVVHYLIDFVKYRYGNVKPTEKPALYWALHGFDQLLHQLTYVAMIGVSLSAMGLWS